MTDITQTLPSHWKYVSEGGATIVFSYVGPANPIYDGTVLRLRKAANIPDQRGTASNEDDPDDPIIEYQARCMERLFPRENLPRLQSVRLERGWLEDLAELHDSKRPEARTGKDHIHFSRKKGVLATDLVGGDWISVEIKVSLLPLFPLPSSPMVIITAKMGFSAFRRAPFRGDEDDQGTHLSILHAQLYASLEGPQIC